MRLIRKFLRNRPKPLQNLIGGGGKEVSFEKLPSLKEVLDEYSDIYMPSEREDVIEAYLLNKPMSSIEIHLKYTSKEKVENFISNLSEFFFVNTNEGEKVPVLEVYVSRFETPPKLAAELGDMPGWKPFQRYNDLEGILYGKYSLMEVAEYCNYEESSLLNFFK